MAVTTSGKAEALSSPASVTTRAAVLDGAGSPVEIYASANVAGEPSGATPTGTVTFEAYGPFSYPFSFGPTSCTGTPTYSSTNPLSGGGATSAFFQLPVPVRGPSTVYLFTADYGGDGNYEPATSQCNAPGADADVPAVGLSGEEFVPIGQPLPGESSQSTDESPGGVSLSPRTATATPLPRSVTGHAYLRRLGRGNDRRLRAAGGAVVRAQAAKRVVAKATTSATGAFTLKLPPGSYTISISPGRTRQCGRQV
ncbi:MAG TPA: hypothetical protein VN817_09145, partial [Solirubrobacteraceae bacterium]|nr:hypothetical protein [Solirubrobacteraceae bacterium]